MSNDKIDEQGEKFEGLEYDNTPVSIPVRIKDGGKLLTLELRQMDGDGLSQWMSIMNGRVKLDSKGRPGKVNYEQFQAALISLCLYDPATNQQVNKSVINRWTSKIQASLFIKCREMNGLDMESAEDAKNA